MKHLKNAGEILLACAAAITSVALLTVTVKICWTVIQFCWHLW